MPQIIVFATLLVMLALFISGKWRYDLVALVAVLFLTIVGIIPAADAFLGFGHPAVVTVAAVLVVSRGLQNAGLVSLIGQWLARIQNPRRQSATLTGVTAILSAFMNNIGALALLMPVGMQTARRRGSSPSEVLMPLAFASILGGLLTMIGTPLNIIIATFRADAVGTPFGVFDFTRVGVFVAGAGVLFLIVAGARLLPQREVASKEELFRVENYIAEIRVNATSSLVSRPLREVGKLTSGGALVVALERGGERTAAPPSYMPIETNDILSVEASGRDLERLVTEDGISLEVHEHLGTEALTSDEVSTVEAIVMPDSRIQNKTVRDISLRQRFGVNLVAVARRGDRLNKRLGEIRFAPGDVLLLQGRAEAIQAALAELDSLPLAERSFRFGQPRKLWLGTSIMAAALALAASGLLAVQVAFSSAAVAMILFDIVSLRKAYASIEWHILILLGSMISVGHAFETTGGADLLAEQLLAVSALVSPVVTLTLVLLSTMVLANVMNNKAAAILIAPIAISVADGMGASIDPFLMAVALGAEFVFLSPIGHQSNILVMGVGGYEFRDYWRVGLPLTIIVLVVAVPLLLVFWPLGL